MAMLAGRGVSKLQSVIFVLALRASTIPPCAGAEHFQELDFCNIRSECERWEVREEYAPRICALDEERPPRWAWPMTRLRFRLTMVESTKVSSDAWWASRVKDRRALLRYRAAPRGFCQWAEVLPSVLCPDCSSTFCSLDASAPWGSNATSVLDAYLPPWGGCVEIARLPASVTRARGTWETCWDPLVPLFVGAGALLVWEFVTIRESASVHAAIGGTGSLVFVAMVVLWWLLRQMRGTFDGVVPFGRSISAMSMLFFTFIPTVRESLIAWVVPDGPSDWFAWLNMKDPIYNLPIGWIFSAVATILAVGAVLFGANSSQKFFASPPEPEGEINFVIGPDGRRIDVLPPSPWSQKFLGFLFWAAGVAMLLSSTYVDTLSVIILVVTLALGNVVHVFRQWLIFRANREPQDFRPLISASTYQEQATEFTEQAVRRLQNFVQTNPGIIHRVAGDDGSELRLRRFSDGGAHFKPPVVLEQDERSSRCSLL